MRTLLYITLSLLLAFVGAEVIDNVKCSRGSDSRGIKSEVHEIRISPCAEAAEGEPCRLTKGQNATIEVDFTPEINARRPGAGMYWMSRVDMIFRGLPANACNGMPCPMRSGTRYTYTATIPLGRELPAGQYPIKLKVFERRRIVFCQTFRIKLVDAEN